MEAEFSERCLEIQTEHLALRSALATDIEAGAKVESAER
jgi:hypothetical protein